MAISDTVSSGPSNPAAFPASEGRSRLLRDPPDCSAVRRAARHGIALAVASLISYWLTIHVLGPVHSVSPSDDLLGGVWAVIATAFVYHSSYHQSATAACSRIAATLMSFVLCLIYLLLFAFHPLGLAVVIGLGSLLLTLCGRPQDVITAAITIAVVLGVAALTPRDAWQEPILRLVDTALGSAVGLGAAWIALRLTRASAAKSAAK